MKRVFAALFLAPSMFGGCATRPGFVPTPRHVFSQFEALREPRSDFPVGALWIDGYGPTGDGAAADNLVTLKSLSGVTFDNGFQASLTLGLLKFLQLDPSYSQKMTAHFSDLTIVRVKDMTKLAGPAEQPRIYEALKAGTITITAIGNAGLDIENRAISEHLEVFGRGTTAIAHTFTIDGKDMFVAFETATSRKTQGPRFAFTLRPGSKKRVVLSSVRVTASVAANANDKCTAGTNAVSISFDGQIAEPVRSIGEKPQSIPLSPPVSDGQGGLFTSLNVSVTRSDPKTCTLKGSLSLAGTRLDRRSAEQPAEM